MVSNQRMSRFIFIPLFALALVTALVFLIASASTPVVAADTPDLQQTHSNMPMTGTMPMTATTPPTMDHRMHQGMMGEDKGMMGNRPMHQPGMGDSMVAMGRRMQMMGMMMQMMGQMHQMMDHMQGMMGSDMPMMQGNMPMSHAMPMTGSMPMTDSMPMTNAMSMGEGMGMMGKGRMDMPMMNMMDMNAMHVMMGQMMDQMMAEMHEMHQTMGMGHGSMNHTMPMTNTTPLSDTTGTTQPDLAQTAQVGAVEIVVTAANLRDAEAATLDFDVVLNSHSEEIAIDLAKTATLRIGEVEIAPTAWETTAPKGHHIKGLLRFPRTTEEGGALLADATEISLVIGGLPGDGEGTFTWEVTSR